jgi:hypothetical protein
MAFQFVEMPANLLTGRTWVEDFFSVPIALGSISNLEQATSEAIAAPVENVAQAMRKESVVHADETGWYERSKRGDPPEPVELVK